MISSVQRTAESDRAVVLSPFYRFIGFSIFRVSVIKLLHTGLSLITFNLNIYTCMSWPTGNLSYPDIANFGNFYENFSPVNQNRPFCPGMYTEKAYSTAVYSFLLKLFFADAQA